MNWHKKLSPQWLVCLLGVVAVALFAVQCAAIEPTPCAGIKIHSNELSAAKTDEYCRYALRERSKVEAYWGATWSKPIRINVSSKNKDSYENQLAEEDRLGTRIEVPDRDSVQVAMPGMRVNNPPLLHQIVHVYAPNANRFLAEGLAVYLQAKLGGDPGYPNFGEDLGPLAARAIKQVGSLEPLDTVRTGQPFGIDPSDNPRLKSRFAFFAAVDRWSAYVVAGSFVGFMIERDGLAQFRALYKTWDYKKTYGKSLKVLEKEWRVSLSQQQ
jgi:hypothetical protein